jgi:hypothetical protein
LQAHTLWMECKIRADVAAADAEKRALPSPETKELLAKIEHDRDIRAMYGDLDFTVPPVESFPMPFEMALKMWLPKVDKADERVKTFRAWLAWDFARRPDAEAKEYNGNPPRELIVKNPVEPGERIAQLKERGIKSQDSFVHFGRLLNNWRRDATINGRVKAGKASAAKKAEAAAKKVDKTRGAAGTKKARRK